MYPRPEPPDGARNHVLLVLDSCRFDSFVEARPRAMGALGAVQRRFSYATWTAPAHYNLLMGLLPHPSPNHVFASELYTREFVEWGARLGVEGVGFSGMVPRLWLPDYLRNRLGYHTRALVSLPVLNPRTPLSADFDSYELMEQHNDLATMVDALVFDHDRPTFWLLNAGETHYPYAPAHEPESEWPRIHGVNGVFQRVAEGRPLHASEAPRFFDQDRLDHLRRRQVEVVRHVDGIVERVRSLSEGNREAVVTEAQALRTAGSDVSAVQRFQTVRRLWERYLEPLRQLVDVRGEMEQRLDALRRGLEEGERRFVAHGAIHRGVEHMLARLARMRRSAFDDHLAALQEIAPLYERLRRDSRWVLGASQALQAVRAGGVAALDFDRRLALVGWRTRYLMSDERLRARVAGLVGYVPEGPIVLGAAAPRPDVPLITRDELRDALATASPVDDVLELLLVRWPDYPVQAQLIAFGQVVGGTFGAVEVVPGAAEQTYRCLDIEIRAWPVCLAQVAA